MGYYLNGAWYEGDWPSANDQAAMLATGMGETASGARTVYDFGPIFDSAANRADNLNGFVPQSYQQQMGGTDPLHMVTTSPRFGNTDMFQYDAWHPQHGGQRTEALYDSIHGQALGNPSNTDMTNAEIAYYGVFGPQGDMRGNSLGADSYINPGVNSQGNFIANQNHLDWMTRDGRVMDTLNTNPYGYNNKDQAFNTQRLFIGYDQDGVPQYQQPQFDQDRGVINATTGYFRDVYQGGIQEPQSVFNQPYIGQPQGQYNPNPQSGTIFDVVRDAFQTGFGSQPYGGSNQVQMQNHDASFMGTGYSAQQLMEMPSQMGNSSRYVDFVSNPTIAQQYQKGSMSGTGSGGGLTYNPSTGQYDGQGQQSYGNNEYGYGNTSSYNPNAYGYGGTDYSSGNPQNATTAIQNAQYMSFTDPTTGTSFATGDGSGFNGVKNGVPVDMYGNPMPGYSGQPDITVYANPQPRDQFGQAMGGDMGSTLYSATAELGGGLTMADAARQNAAFESVFSSGAQDHMFYEGQLNNLTANNGWTDTNVFQPQQINGYTYQPQIATTTWGVNNPTVDYNIANLNPQNNPQAIWV
jgi:hypothetical protein